jgi:hypothetical protein
MKYVGVKFKRRIPLSKRKGESYREAIQKMNYRLSDPDWVQAFCIHEAVHIFYNRQFGATDFNYYGPLLEYVREIDDFDGHFAAIEPKPFTRIQMTFEEGLALQARLASSGSVCAAKVPNIKDHGAGDDFERFELLCEKLSTNRPKLDAQALWDKAVGEVKADIEKPEIKEAIIAEAEYIRRRVYPWATLPIVDWTQNRDETSNPL